MVRFVPLTALALLASAGIQDAAAQRRAPGQPLAESSELDVSARLGTKTYTASVPGTCKHEPSASIYEVPAALYTVETQGGEGDIKALNFTLWRPKNGSADQVSLSLDAGSSSYRVDVNPRNKPVGEATVQLKPAASGGTFELKGKDAKGTPLNITINCPTFAGIVAEGG